jgi:nitroreductase/NAD-dependent dihydropyrimidine dehydrogenase PreA subunit
MPLFTVNKDKCPGDGKCAAVCPVRIIKIDEATRLPAVIEGKEELCINCGHCVAICPKGALSLTSMPVDSCEPLKPGWRLGPEAVEQFIKGRRSIRTYKDTPVPRQTLEKLIDIARYAPSGINRQPVYWAIIDDKDKVRRLAELTVEWMRTLIKEGSELAASLRFENIVKAWEKGNDRVLRGAPATIIAYGLKDDPMAPQACTIALTYLELAALPFGLGTCWAGYAHMAINMYPDAQKFIGLSKRTSSFGAMMVGYPKFEYCRIPMRNKPHIKEVA